VSKVSEVAQSVALHSKVQTEAEPTHDPMHPVAAFHRPHTTVAELIASSGVDTVMTEREVEARWVGG